VNDLNESAVDMNDLNDYGVVMLTKTTMCFGQSERAFVYSVARRYVRNDEDANDVAQDAMVLAYRYRSSFRGDSQYRTWLYRIAATTALSFLRSTRRRVARAQLAQAEEVAAAVLGGASPIPDDVMSEKEQVASLLRNVESLAPAYRDVVELRCQEMSEAEVAKHLGLTISTVKIRAHRARKMLRLQIDSEVLRAA
jgi:RNA polymerase sigma-70 factor, ECF subfamily